MDHDDGARVRARGSHGRAERSGTLDPKHKCGGGLDIAGIWLLAGQPKDIQRWLLGCLAAQVVIALAAAGLRPYTAVAFGVLVPTLGLALCGLWAVRSGTFPPRASGTTD